MLLREKMEKYPFSPSEQQIVDYLLLENNRIENKTTAEISKETYSSKSTLVRIAQKLDFTGWSEFKKAFLKEVEYLEKFAENIDANYPFTSKDSLMTIASKIATLEKETIEDTLDLLDHNTLRKAVNFIDRSEKIHVFSVSNNVLISQEFAHNMSRISKDVRIHGLQSELVFDAALVDVKDCAIVISYTGETSVLKTVTQLLKEEGIPIICLTSLGDNFLSEQSDCVLTISTREKMYSKIATFSTDMSITYILDVLYSCYFAENYEKNLNQKIKLSAKLEKDRSTKSGILKE